MAEAVREWEALREQGKLEGEEEEEEEDIYAEARMIDVSLVIKLLRFKLHVVFAFPSLLSFSLIHLLPPSLPPFLPSPHVHSGKGAVGRRIWKQRVNPSCLTSTSHLNKRYSSMYIHVHYQCSPTP